MKATFSINKNIITASAVLFCSCLFSLLAQGFEDQPYQQIGERENLGANINSEFVEILPIIAPDGRTIYFDRKYDPNNVGGAGDDDDIYYSELQSNGTWSPAKNIGTPLNSVGSDVMFWISPDGTKALVHSGAIHTSKKVGFAIAEKIDGKWQAPQPLEIDGLTNIGQIYYATMTGDAKQLIIAYNPDSNSTNLRALDIFVSFPVGKGLLRWTKPKSLGIDINTPENFEGAPFIAADSRTLYFISDRKGGLGSSDIYFSRRKNETWTSWSKPKNLGSPINTNSFEASLSIPAQRDYIYISSAGNLVEDNYGSADIYRFKLPDSLKPMKALNVKGKLIANKKGVKGLIRAEDNNSEIASTTSDDNGNFNMVLPAADSYKFTGWAQGLEEVSVKKNTKNKEDVFVTITLGTGQKNVTKEVIENSNSEPLERTKSANVNVYFATGSSQLTDASTNVLKKSLKKILNNNALILAGHTDSQGEDTNNEELSKQRAETVKQWLVANGIAEGSIKTEWFGETKPASTNNTTQGKARNRRVEIRTE